MQKDKDRDEENEKRDPIRFWGGMLGVSALALAVVVGIVVQMRAPKPQTAARTQAAVRTPATKAAVRPPAAVKPVAVKPAAVERETKAAAVKPEMSAKTLSAAERRISEELWVEQRKLDAGARAAVAKRDGERRVAEAIAGQLRVPVKLVTDLRGRKISYGELTVALALSQQLARRDKTTPPRAVNTILERRKAGHGWAAIAHDLGLKLTTALGEVKKADQQLARLDTAPSKTRKS